ncbi:NUDIX domain-containing protein [Candidatus Dojkabacteria bacterium]|jgi:8-oxo-dGTP pyrophosphatase MutT (NUDIX family)|nr:NUDIX domain-containing protein [Candidatus Dojkabacteria bacterium]
MSDLKVFQDGFEIKTIVYLLRINKKGKKEVLLAKHRKQGKWNGFGGKVGDKDEWKNETIEMGATREGEEELGIIASDLKNRAIIDFLFYSGDEFTKVQGHVFFTSKWKGKIVGIGMDSPTWFQIDEIPWDEMWTNDRAWLEQLLLSDKFLEAIYEFNKGDNKGEKAFEKSFIWK